MPQHHHTPLRGSSPPGSPRFGRMFPDLEPLFEAKEHGSAEEALRKIAATMFEPEDAGGTDEGPIPAAFTYLGQFIDHDITFDPLSNLQRLQDPDAVLNFRTPALDLDSLYGDGPNMHPFMYDPGQDDGKTSFLISKTPWGDDDLPRNGLPSVMGLPRGRALIGDPRNDVVVIVAQLHLLFLKFHNRVVETLKKQRPELGVRERQGELFEEAQRITRWHYQWIVVHDFLRRIVGEDVVDAVNDRTLRFYEPRVTPDGPFRNVMPVEFSAAAFRYGHSMIRPRYRLKASTPEIPILTRGKMKEEHQDLRGFRPLPPNWTIDWSFFVEVARGDRTHLQHARKIDTKLAAPLKTVPGTGDPNDLALRNLRRGLTMQLPSGQEVARAMDLDPIGDSDLDLNGISNRFANSAPLWFYILKESELLSQGAHLGPVGGRIVAEVLWGLLKFDASSFVHEQDWRPHLPDGDDKPKEDFTLADLVDFTLPAARPDGV